MSIVPLQRAMLLIILRRIVRQVDTDLRPILDDLVSEQDLLELGPAQLGCLLSVIRMRNMCYTFLTTDSPPLNAAITKETLVTLLTAELHRATTSTVSGNEVVDAKG